MTYVISSAMVVSHVLPNQLLQDIKFFDAQVARLQRIGLKRFLRERKVEVKILCEYFTNLVGTIEPITSLDVSN